MCLSLHIVNMHATAHESKNIQGWLIQNQSKATENKQNRFGTNNDYKFHTLMKIVLPYRKSGWLTNIKMFAPPPTKNKN